MAWTVINNQDQSGNIHPANFELNMALSDPLTTVSFELEDITSSIALDFNQSVMIWDENAQPDHAVNGVPIQCVPTLNLVVDPTFYFNPTTSFTKGGTYPATITITTSNAAFVFSNQASTGIAHDARMTQTSSFLAPGYVTPGQMYIFSIYASSPVTPTNMQYYLQMNWLDINLNALSSTTPVSFSSTTTSTRRSTSAVAPANAAYVQAQFGVYATNSTNSGTINMGTLLIEPVWFPSRAMGNNVPVTYPSPDCNFFQVNTYIVPDGTYARNNRLFWGYIANLEATYEGTKRTWKVDCRPMGDVIENGGTNTPIDVTYTGFTDVQIINDLITNHFSGVLSTGQTNSSQPSTTAVTGPTIDSISFTDQTFREVLNNIVDITGFAYYIDPYMFIRYNPIPYNYSLFNLLSSTSVQPDYLTTFPPQEYTYIKDGTQVRNSVKVTGGTFQVTIQDIFSGDGATKVFNLTNIPVSIITISENGGTSTYAPTNSNKIGVTGQDVNGVSGIVALMDAGAQKVTFNTAPGSGTNNVVISYTQNRPVSILVEENTSIGLYRRFVSKVEDSNLASNAAGKVRGESELAQWAYPVQNITFKLSSQLGNNWQPINMFLMPGTTILFTSTLDNLTSVPFVIQTVKVTSEGGGVNIYEYEAGVYRPKLTDHIRNVQKSLARNPSTGGSTPIQLIYEVLRDTTLYSDSVTATPGTPPAHYTYGTSLYGYSSYN